MLHPLDSRLLSLPVSRWRVLLAPFVLACGLMAAGATPALEISPPRLQSGLGQALQLQVNLRLSPGEQINRSLNDPCFKVELTVGERQLKPSEFMRAIDWQAAGGGISMRVQTQAPVTEPLVHLSLGCPRQQFSLMLDPALVLSPSSAGLHPAASRASASSANSSSFTPRKMPRQPDPAAARRGGPALRLDASLSERSSDSPALASADWFAPLAGIRLLLALDVGGPEGATPETDPGVEGPRPDRIKQAEAHFVALQNEQKQLQAEMAQLSSELLSREQRRAAGQTPSTGWWLGLAALATLAGGAAWFWQRRQTAGRG